MLIWHKIADGVPTHDGMLCLLYSSINDHCVGPVRWDAKIEGWRDVNGEWATDSLSGYFYPDNDVITHWAQWNSPFTAQQIEESG